MSSLPILDSPRSIRASRTSKWRAAVLIGIHVLIGLHITHWLVTGRSVTPVEPSEAMAFSRVGVVNAGLIFFCVTILLTLIFGRLFCGWACHLVALQDLSRWLLAKVGIRPRPLRSRLLAWVPFLAFFYMFLWPAIYRAWIGDSFAQSQLEMTTEHFWATFPGWTIGALTFLICGFVIVYFLGAKGFCTYACPYGAVFSLADRIAPMRVRVTDACEGCGHCTASCTSNVQVHREVRQFGMVIDDGCMKCLDCVSVCPNDALYYGWGPSRRRAKAAVPHPEERPASLTWTEEIVLGLGFAVAFFIFRGLYGIVPFLMSLGVAAVLAFLVLTTWRLVTRPHLSLRRFRLKRQGKLLPAGWVLAGAMTLLVAFWLHSGLVHLHQHLGERDFQALQARRRGALDVTALASDPTGSELVRIHRSRDRLEKAERLGLVSTRGNAWRLAWMHYLAGSPVDFSRAADRALDRREFPVEIHQLLALEALREGDSEAARTSFEAAIEADSERLQPHINLGLLLIESGQLQPAGAVFERGLRFNPDSTELLYNAGMVRAYQGDVAGAIEYLEHTLDLDPSHVPARENLAGLLASSGRYADSVRHYRLAIDLSPEDADTHYLLARALWGLGDFSAAQHALQECLRLEPEHEEAIILRSSIESQSVD